MKIDCSSPFQLTHKQSDRSGTAAAGIARALPSGMVLPTIAGAMSGRLLIAPFVLVFLCASGAFAMKLSSPSFSDGHPLPRACGYREENQNPELRISRVPGGTRSLALIMEDPDAPGGTFVHWLVWNLPPTTVKLLPGKLPSEARTGRNDFGNDRYDGPAPPSGTHRYFFRLFALDERLALAPGAGRRELEEAMRGHVLDEASLMGTFAAGGS